METHEFKGHTGTVVVTPKKVILKYKKVIGAAKGEKEIRLKSITGIQVKKPGGITNGYIQFSFSGSSDQKGRSVFDAVKDENTIMITKKQYDDFVKCKELIEQYIDALEDGGSNSSNVSVADELKKLAELKDAGILTEDEFTSKKKQLLGI